MNLFKLYFLGFMYFFRGLGNIVGPLIVGTIYDATSSYSYGCYMAAGCMFIGSILNQLAHIMWKKNVK